MKYPKFLNTNLNLIAPSFGCTTEPYSSRLDMAIKHFKEYNINTIEGMNTRNSIGYRSNTNELCAKEFMDAYKDNNFIMSVGGGNLMNEILDYIDFDYIKTLPPTYFMGYSDNTNLTFTLTTICDVATIYGYNAPEFGALKLEKSMIDQLEFIKGKKLKFSGNKKFELNPIKSETDPYLGYNLDTVNNLIVKNYNAPFTGRLIGGCLDILQFLIGTKYDKVNEFNERYKEDGFIWYLESCDLEAWNTKLVLLQMERAGWFKYLKGFVIGRPFNYNNDFIGLEIHQSYIDVLSKYNVPILLNTDIGHLKPCIPVINGAIAIVNIDNDNYSIEYQLR